MSSCKVGVIGIPGKWSTEVLADAIAERTGFRLVVDMGRISGDLTHGRLTVGDIDLCTLDGLIVKKISQQYSPNVLDRIELLRVAEKAGVRVFSRPDTIIRMIDRLACTVTLSNGEIPMPATTVTEDRQQALAAVKQYSAAVFKPLYSTKAKGMRVIEDSQDEAKTLEAIDAFQSSNPMMYIQQKVDLPGRDFGMVFLGGKYLGSYARVARSNSWNTTTGSGGKYASHDPPPATIEMAARAESLFGMDFTTVDVADTASGPVVFEVSAFGGFRGAEEGIGIDAAALYADYALQELS